VLAKLCMLAVQTSVHLLVELEYRRPRILLNVPCMWRRYGYGKGRIESWNPFSLACPGNGVLQLARKVNGHLVLRDDPNYKSD
jgi:hypothetical protein